MISLTILTRYLQTCFSIMYGPYNKWTEYISSSKIWILCFATRAISCSEYILSLLLEHKTLIFSPPCYILCIFTLKTITLKYINVFRGIYFLHYLHSSLQWTPRGTCICSHRLSPCISLHVYKVQRNNTVGLKKTKVNLWLYSLQRRYHRIDCLQFLWDIYSVTETNFWQFDVTGWFQYF